MPATKKTFDLVEPIFYDLVNEDNSLVFNEFNTAQGMDLVGYEIFKNLHDKKIKNNTVNVLTDKKGIKEVISFNSDSNLLNLDLNSFIFFGGNNVSSSSRAMTTSPSFSSSDSLVTISNYTSSPGQNFNIDFLDDEYVQIKFFDGKFTKFLNVNSNINDSDYRKLKFETVNINTNTEYYSGYKFLYNYDEKNNFLSLYHYLSGTSYGSKRFTVITTQGNELVAADPTRDSIDRGVLKVKDNINKISRDNLNTFNFYEVLSGNYNISNESVPDIKSNLLCYYPYEATTLSGSKLTGQKLFNVLNYFDLKNHISNNNYVNSVLPFEDIARQRSYNTILNENTSSEDRENLLFNYNFYTKEYIFKPDTITKFTLPDSLYPFERINIKDTNLAENGSYASLSPYFSDKIYKKIDSNENVIDPLKLEGILFGESNFPLALQNDKNLLKLQTTFIKPNNNASFLCSWLSGGVDSKGEWVDRYYFSKPNQYTEFKLGTPNNVFDNIRQANKFFLDNGIENTYFDVKSNLIFDPKTILFYERLGNKSINKVINNFDNHLVKSTLNNKFSGFELEDQNELIFSRYGYENIAIDEELDSNIFNISFDLKLDSPVSLNSYQIIGNKYEDGFAIKNNFYFTPFVYFHEGNKIFVYDSNFNLIQENIYPTIDKIKDILYLEQQSNFVIITDDSIVKTSFTGEIIDVNTISDIDLKTDAGVILSGYKSRFFFDYNKAIFNLSSYDAGEHWRYNPPVVCDLNNLSISALETLSDVPLSSFDNILKPRGKNFVGVNGKSPVLLTDNIVASINSKYSSFNDAVTFTNIDDNKEIYEPIKGFDRIIYSIASLDKKLYIQSFDYDGNGKISIYSSEREYLTSFGLSAASVSGLYLDFIEEDKEIKLLSFSRKDDKKIVADKINLSNYTKETYFLDITGADINLLENNGNFMSPVNFQYLNNKYSEYQDKLCFQFNIDNYLKSLFLNPEWQEDDPDSWNNPGAGYAPWDAQLLDKTTESVEEVIVEFPYTNLNNTISIDFNIPGGLINLYFNGELLRSITFESNIIPNNRILYPNIFINVPNLFRDSITDFVNSNQFYGTGGSISNLKVYNTTINRSLAEYLYLKDKKIDDLNFDIPCGTRNNIEEVDNLYSYIIPGRKDNNIKIYIKNAYMDETTKATVKEYLKNTLPRQLPSNVDFVDFNFDINT